MIAVEDERQQMEQSEMNRTFLLMYRDRPIADLAAGRLNNMYSNCSI
jgi:hypothetical protein